MLWKTPAVGVIGQGGQIRVLVADDDAAVVETLTAVLETEGIAVVATASDAAGAVAAALEHRPDVALVDVEMPGGGVAAARDIAELCAPTRVLALSASGTDRDVVRMLEAGALGYLLKLSRPAVIADAVRRASQGIASLDERVAAPLLADFVTRVSAERRDRAERARRREELLAMADALDVVFQPVVALADGRVTGYEALSRFPGGRPPDEWFALAAREGMSTALERAAVARALQRAEALPQECYLAVNVSPAALLGGALEPLELGGHGERLVLEITEHAPVERYDALDAALARYRSRHVRVAIDDAGAGFASLRHILQLRPEIVKLDRSLTAGIAHDRSRRALAAGLVSFAAEVDMTIVAEGVETEEERDALREIGVQYAQGYLLGRPAPAEQWW